MRDKKLTINWINPRPGLAGGVKSNRLIAEAMVRRGHKVNIAYVALPPEVPPVWRVRTYVRYWINRYKNRKDQSHHFQVSTANLIPVLRRPIIEADVPDADVTIATWWETAHWIKNWSDAKGKKAYFIRHHELHGGDIESVKETYRLPYKKLVIASWLKRVMADNYGDNFAALIPNGVDWQQFSFQVRVKQSVPTLGMLYGIVGWKGAETAFTAIRIVQKIFPDLRVICFGSHRIKLEHNPPDNFEYYFRPAQDLIPKLYKKTDCWLVPSTLEGFGMPGIEAAACGCPVVSTRCGGPEDYIKEGHNGFLANVGDAGDIAEKLIKVISMNENAWQEMSKNSASYVKRFDWDISARLLESTLLEKIVD
jgi:glycosyltransferase involved in cell wall biosynthesis